MMKKIIVFLMGVVFNILSFNSFCTESKGFLVGIRKWDEQTLLISLCMIESEYEGYVLSNQTAKLGKFADVDLQVPLTSVHNEKGIRRFEILLNPQIISENRELYIKFTFEPTKPELEEMRYRYDASDILSKVEISEKINNCSELKRLEPTDIGIGSYYPQA